jgi:hypothetical protein
VVTSLKAAGAFTLDEITVEQLQKYFMAGTVTTTAQVTGSSLSKLFVAADKIKGDRWFEIGDINITVTQVDDNGVPVIYEEGVDYTLDEKAGMIFIIPASEGGNIADDSEVKVTYDRPDATIKTFLGGEITSLRGKMKFVSEPAFGEIQDIEGFGSLTPEGSYTAVSEEYIAVDMKLEFIKHSDFSPGLFKVRNRGNTTD